MGKKKLKKLEKLVDFHLEVNASKRVMRFKSCEKPIKKTKRKAIKKLGVAYLLSRNSVGDSTADHSWGTALWVLTVSEVMKLDINVARAYEIAIAHDICEYRMDGFDTDSFNVSRRKESRKHKKQVERKDMGRLLKKYGMRDIFKAWEEYEAAKTPEARFVRVMNGIEATVHLIEKGDRGRGGKDADHTALAVDDAVRAYSEMRPLLRVVKKRLKKQYEKEGSKWKKKYDVV